MLLALEMDSKSNSYLYVRIVCKKRNCFLFIEMWTEGYRDQLRPFLSLPNIIKCLKWGCVENKSFTTKIKHNITFSLYYAEMHGTEYDYTCFLTFLTFINRIDNFNYLGTFSSRSNNLDTYSYVSHSSFKVSSISSRSPLTLMDKFYFTHTNWHIVKSQSKAAHI